MDGAPFASRPYATRRPEATGRRGQDRWAQPPRQQGLADAVSTYERPTRRSREHLVVEKKAGASPSSMLQALRDAGWSQREVVNVPNALSMARMLSGPVIGWWILEGQWDLVVPALALSAASDWLDGFAARHLNQQSVLGSYLDPLADKALIGCVTFALAKAGVLPVALACVILGRDVSLVAGGVVLRARELGWRWPGAAEFFRLGGGTAAAAITPLPISKVNTVLQLALAGGCAVQGLTGWPPGEALLALGMLTAGTTVWSAVAYARAFLGVGGGRAMGAAAAAAAGPPRSGERAKRR